MTKPELETFYYSHEVLHTEHMNVREIIQALDSPCYIYSRYSIEQRWHAFDRAFISQPHQICYAVKANSNLAILNVLARLGSGFDVVSRGELSRVIAAGGDSHKTVYSGVGKQLDDIEYAIDKGVYCINVESMAELTLLQSIGVQRKSIIPVAIRVNPNIDAMTHPYISTGLKENKFGIELNEARMIYHNSAHYPNLAFKGIAYHIGSQITQIQPFLAAFDAVIQLYDELILRGMNLEFLDLGGGIGIRYTTEVPLTPQQLISALMQRLAHRQVKIILEPGRSIVGEAGILVTKVIHTKKNGEHEFAIVDAAMNDFMRPALYQASHNIIPLQKKPNALSQVYTIVGPVCESSDFLAKKICLPTLQTDDLLALCHAGAYGFSMSSNYNSRPRCAEVLVDGGRYVCIRKRETIEELYAHERIIPW